MLAADEALASFNKVMLMETYSLADNGWESSLRTDFNPYETYKTRLVRVDQAYRTGSRDIIRHALRKCLRALWFFVRCRGGIGRDDAREPDASSSSSAATTLESGLMTKSYQNTARLAEIMTRFLVALLAGAFLVIPLVILSCQSSGRAHLITVSVCIVVFSLLVSLVSRASNEQIMVASAGYAAVLVVFLSNSPNGGAVA